ncbi:MAG: hypothetical protein JW966_12430, partial [Anaerolineae bacterium]|nr:hypothetical protein [Anaerolineae bacterium]
MSDYFPDPPAEESDDAAYSDGTPPEFASPEAGYAEPDAPEAVVFEELTLAEALAFLLWRPGQTLRLFWYVLSYDPDAVHARSATPVQPPVPLARGDRAAADSIAAPVFDAAGGSWQAELPQHAGGRVAAALGDLGERVTWAWIVVLSLACLLAVWGGHVLYDAAIDPAMHIAYDTNGALLWFVAAGAVVVGAELFQGRDWWARRFPRAARWLWSHIIQGPAPLAWNAGLTLALIAAL